MFLAIGLVVGLACSIPGAVVTQHRGTLLNFVPVALWFVALASVSGHGLSRAELEALGAALVGILLALFAGQVLDQRRRDRPSR